jgi:hypothetical protein
LIRGGTGDRIRPTENYARTLLLLGLFTLAWRASASAQVVELIAPQFGITFVNYSGNDIDSDTGIGFEAGGRIRAGSRLYVEAGFFWSTAGADVTIPAGGGTTDDLRIQDVSVPVGMALRLFGGVTPSFPTGVSDNDLGVVKEDLNSTLWSGRAGLGFDLVVLSIDGGYDFGLGNIFELGTESVKRNEWFIELGARFGF